MIKYEPIEIKYGDMKKPRYYCKRCSKRIFKRHSLCPHCYKGIDWKTKQK